ncbi:unnamed protein product [Ceutorhynchus assimilis]|uniref:C2H2-type domain-containing protein n=1 Tax=Ceutorhynchus assimilis TaxID=467358 RepID=A0A9P0GPU9_9CUCU|nr:unnamed protein product [Ceutorhynchus assimilis]
MEFSIEEPNSDIFKTEYLETIPVHYVMGTDEAEEVEYVYNDDIGIPDGYQEITNIILEDGTTAMIINGALITDDGQSLIIQDEVDFNECSASFELQNELQNQFFQIMVPEDIQDTTQNVITYVKEETAIESEPNNQIFYIQQENNILEPMPEQYEIAENPNEFTQFIQLADDEVIVDENGQVVDLQELMKKYQVNGDFECTVEADGSFSFSTTTDTKKRKISEIKGKNIATGEVISISEHLKKFKKGRNFASNNNRKTMRCDATRNKTSIKDLKKLINKKIPIGQTDKGKNLVAKITNIIKKHPAKSPINTQSIISAKKKSQSLEPAAVETEPVITETDLTVAETEPALFQTEPVTSESAVEIDLPAVKTTSIRTEPVTPSELTETETTFVDKSEHQPNLKVIVQKKKIKREAFEVISKVLGGLMDMDSGVKMLKNKTLIVTMVEKVFNQETKKYSKNVSYCAGHMIKEEKLDSSLGQNQVGSDNKKNLSGTDESFANLTIEITQNAAGKKNTRVTINPPSMFQCKTCGLSYRTSALLKIHSMQQHSDPPPNFGSGLECKTCLIKFTSLAEAEKHTRLTHSQDKSLGVYECVDCKQRFKNPPQIRKHMESHFMPSFCSICQIRFKDMATLKRHTMYKHTKTPEIESKENSNRNNKFTCNICGKFFSRNSNLLRHIEIHKGVGANYQCAICYCSYHFVSSLTRHIISTHVEKKPTLEAPLTNLELPNDIIEEQIEGFDFLQNDQMVQMIPLENISEDALEQVLQDVPTGPELVEEMGPI